MILDVIGKYHKLRRAGATDNLIWMKLEAYRADFGTALLPQTVLTVLHSLCIDLR